MKVNIKRKNFIYRLHMLKLLVEIFFVVRENEQKFWQNNMYS